MRKGFLQSRIMNNNNENNNNKNKKNVTVNVINNKYVDAEMKFLER